MSFGSYDESEQQDQDIEAEDDEAVNVHENDHQGDVEFNSEASTDQLLDQLEAIKDEEGTLNCRREFLLLLLYRSYEMQEKTHGFSRG